MLCQAHAGSLSSSARGASVCSLLTPARRARCGPGYAHGDGNVRACVGICACQIVHYAIAVPVALCVLLGARPPSGFIQLIRPGALMRWASAASTYVRARNSQNFGVCVYAAYIHITYQRRPNSWPRRWTSVLKTIKIHHHL